VKPDRHDLYEASVQGVDYDLDFLERAYRRHHGRSFHVLREDFCGTAALAAHWVLRSPAHRAWGVDRDRSVLAWARDHRLPRMREAARRLTLVHGDVRHARVPPADLVCALNFSYWVFHERRDLVAYFRGARRGLRRGGLLVLNAFGGSEAMGTLTERRRIGASRSVTGDPVPAFTYEWEHARFNPLDHRLLCHIHFHLRGGTVMRRAFTYDWRMWTVPEIRDALEDAGFRSCDVYVEGWNERLNRPDEVYRLRRNFENQEGWLAMIVAGA
jgi:SAM-dependent methyltransferase